MTPVFYINIFGDFAFPVYVFGLSIVVCFFLFLWMLKKLSVRFWFEYHFFTNSMLWYFLSVFIFSRLFYVISMWKDMQHIENISSFFIMTDYNFSLFWAIFGFCIILLLNTKLLKKSIHKYIDWFTLAFLFTIIFWFIGLFLSGSGYWESTTSWLWIPYISNSLSTTPTGKFLPIALIYSGLSFVLFSILYILSMYIKVRGLIGYVWIWVFSSFVLILESYSAKPDAFSVTYNISFSQMWAIIFIIISFYWIYRVMNISRKSQKTILGDVNN